MPHLSKDCVGNISFLFDCVFVSKELIATVLLSKAYVVSAYINGNMSNCVCHIVCSTLILNIHAIV